MDKMQTKESVNKLLKIIGSGVVLSSSLFAPNVLLLLEPLIGKKSIDESSHEMKRLLRHMRRLELIEHTASDQTAEVMLTIKGRKRLKLTSLDDILIPRPKSWDGRWRIITFDIPQIKKRERHEFLMQLHRLGFKKMLQSMWVYPYDCEDEVLEIANELGIQKFVMFITGKITTDVHADLLNHYENTLKGIKLSTVD